VVKQIEASGVIDAFMAQNTDIKEILWDAPFDGPTTVQKMQDFAIKLTINQDVESYMQERGFEFERQSTKRTHWVNPNTGETRSTKPTRDFAEQNGPNNGFMRVFFHHVFIKLRQFNADYGFDESLVDALYDGDTLTLVNKKYDKDWTVENTPRHWVLPQMHYLGVFANDIASGDDQNFALTINEPPVATPVDLDATWRGDRIYSFIKVLSSSQATSSMEYNYATIK